MRVAALLLLLAASCPARAQVTFDPRALEGLSAPATETPGYRLREQKRAPVPSAPARSSREAGPKLSMPSAPSPAAHLPPPLVVPVRPVGLPPPAPLAAGATGRVLPLPRGVRVTFGDGDAHLNTLTEAAIEAFGRSVAAIPGAGVSLFAYAAGSPADPSSPRRLALARALAARAVMLRLGILSPRILVHAMGAASGPGWADRVDMERLDPDR